MAKLDNFVMPSGDEPRYERGGKDRPVVSTAAPATLRALLLGGAASPADLAKAAVNLQLAAWEVTKAEAALRPHDGLGKIADLDFGRLQFAGVLGENARADVEVIRGAMGKGARALGREFWTWERVPYAVRCAGLAVAKDVAGRPKKKTRVAAGEQLLADVDEWVLRNETYLRSVSRKLSSATPQDKTWTFGLVRIADVPVVVPGHAPVCDDAGSDALAVKIPRAPLGSLPGYTILDAKRVDAVYLQPSSDAFRLRWGIMTDGILTGLNWDNVFVAGGVVLGALLTPEIPPEHADAPHVNKMDEWRSSDIDMYVYGLGPDLANEKIEHIAATYKKNLPEGAPFLVVRNSQTVTLYSEWPRRRVQIVLKLIGSPREVLLNFDLDICAAGFDGSDVFMLPRCVRALETGTNVFTMDLINGHYLGDRKATRDKRVFKYANKGYGIRILPTYIAALSTYSDRKKLSAIARGERLYAEITLPKIASDSRSWTQKIISEYKKVGTQNRPFHWPHGAYPPVKSEKPVFSHAMLESYAQVSSEPLGRSCLTGFSLLMRHVALWEEEVNGNIMIFEDLWATDTYGEGPLQQVAYDDSPPYAWDESFSIKGFALAIDGFNEKEASNVQENLSWISESSLEDKPISAARTTYGSTVSEVLSPNKDILIPILIPDEFLEFANEMTVQALRQALNLDQSVGLEPLRPVKIDPQDDEGEGGEKLVIWRLDKILNWQMLDRRIDEVREALWAFHRTNERMVVEGDQRMKLLKTNISRRAIRTTIEDETEAFVRWVARKPYHESTKLPAMYVLNEDYGMDDSEDDDDGNDDDDDDDDNDDDD